MIDDAYDKMLKKFLIPLLRKKSLYWPARNEALKLARVERGLYKCNNCEKLFGRTEVHADHIKSVINVKTGFTTWDNYIKSLFCDVSNYSILCIPCHNSKTLIEQNLRKINKKKKKS